MPSEATLARLYTERALRLIRLGNGQAEEVRRELIGLSIEIRGLLAGTASSGLSRRALDALLRDIDAVIATRFSVIAEQQASTAAQLAVIEAAWAQRTSAFSVATSERTAARIAESVMIFGIPLAIAWRRQGEELAMRVSGAVRDAATRQMPSEALLGRVLGQGRRGRETGGLLQQAEQHAAALAHTTVAQITNDARIATWKANGVNAFRWHAVLDEKTTAGCALRNGLLYDIDTLAPIRHDVPIERRPPRHWRCRSILLPMAYADDIPMPPDGGQSTFREYFDGLTEAEQDHLFGRGRAALFRRGVITQADLVGQGGQVLSLEELRIAHVTPETQIALWWKQPRGLVSVGSVSPSIRSAMSAADDRVFMTEYFRKKQLERHPDLGAEEYSRLPAMMINYRVALKQGADDVLVLGDAGHLMVAVLRKNVRGHILLRSFSRTRPARVNGLMALPIVDGDWDWWKK